MNQRCKKKKIRLQGNLASSICERVLYFKTVMVCVASVLFWPERVINYVALLVTSVCHFSMITSGISPVIIFFSGMSEVDLVVVSCNCVLGLDRNRKDEKSWALLCYLKRRIHATCLVIRWESLEEWNTSHHLFSYLSICPITLPLCF